MNFDEEMLGFVMKFGIAVIIICIVILVANWRIFKKAGKPGWHSLIPYYNTYEMFEFSWSAKMGYVAVGVYLAYTFLNGASELYSSDTLNLLSGAAALAYVVLYILQSYKLSKSFGHDIPFALGLIFFGPIFLCILAFGNSYYEGPGGAGSVEAAKMRMEMGYTLPQNMTTYSSPYSSNNPPSTYGYETFTTANRPVSGQQQGFRAQGVVQQGFQAQGAAQQNIQTQGYAQQNAPAAPLDHDSQPDSASPALSSSPYGNFGSSGNYGNSNYSGTSNPFDSGNPYQ